MVCKEEMSIKESVLEHHIQSKNHVKGKKSINVKEKQEDDIVEALQVYDKEVYPLKETLPINQHNV